MTRDELDEWICLGMSGMTKVDWGCLGMTRDD